MAVQAEETPLVPTGCPEAPLAVLPAAVQPAGVPAQRAALPSGRVLVAFGLFILIVGSASVAIRFTYHELAPYWGGFLRFLLAGAIFWAIVAVRRIPLPHGRALAGAALYGLLSTGLAFLFALWGLIKTPASVYAIIMSIIPLLTLIFASLQGQEKLRGRGVLGALLAVAGIVVIMGSSLSSGLVLSPPHLLAIVLGASCMAQSGVVAKRIQRSNPFVTNAIAMTLGAVVLLAGSLLIGEPRALPASREVWLVLLYLVTIGGLVVFSLYFYVVSHWTASGVSYGFVLSPIVTVILAASLTGEAVTWVFLLGGAVVLFGVWVGVLSGNGKGGKI